MDFQGIVKTRRLLVFILFDQGEFFCEGEAPGLSGAARRCAKLV